jgi:hypothetical protein
MKVGLAAILIMAATTLAGAAAAGQDYEIKLTRPEKAGNEYRAAVVTTLYRAVTFKDGDKVVRQQSETTTTSLDAAVKVLATDEAGAVSRMTLTVDKFTVKEGEAEAAAALPRGTVVTALVKDGDKTFEIDGKAVAPEVALALKCVVLIGRDWPVDDEASGAKGRKKVGQDWSVDAQAIATQAASQGLTISKENFKGTLRLDKVEKVGGAECMDISYRMTASKVKGELPAGFTLLSCSFEVTGAEKAPVDPAARLLEQSVVAIMAGVARGKPDPKGPELTMEPIVRLSQKATYSPVEAKPPAPAKTATPK